MSERPYVLGTGEDELARLGLQHRLWSDAAHAAWLAAGLAPGQRVLDVGCGPGYAAFDLAQIVGRAGAVLAVDESPGFVAHANEQAARRGLPQLRALVADAHALGRALAPRHPSIWPMPAGCSASCAIPKPCSAAWSSACGPRGAS